MAKHEPNSPEEVAQLKMILAGIAGVIALMLLIFVIFFDHHISVPKERRYTLDGDEIQDNGLTAEQEADIRLHCAEKPKAFECQ